MKNRLKVYYEVFLENLYNIIYLKYYGNLSENEKAIKKEIKENVMKMFNNGDITFEGVDRGLLRGRIQK